VAKPSDEELWGPQASRSRISGSETSRAPGLDATQDGAHHHETAAAEPGTNDPHKGPRRWQPVAIGGTAAVLAALLSVGLTRRTDSPTPVPTPGVSTPGGSTSVASAESVPGSGLPVSIVPSGTTDGPVVTRGPGVQRRAKAVAITQRASEIGRRPLDQLSLGGRTHLAAGQDGTLYISDADARMVFAIPSDNSTVDVIAGSRSGPAQVSAVLNEPGPIVVDALGGLVIADQPTPGVPGRVIRMLQTGTADVLLTDDRSVDYLYADDLGNAYVQYAPRVDTGAITVVRMRNFPLGSQA
jgi:hypothetical protein